MILMIPLLVVTLGAACQTAPSRVSRGARAGVSPATRSVHRARMGAALRRPTAQTRPAAAERRPARLRSPAKPPVSSRRPSHALSGLATWYGRPFHGRRTASGSVYNMHRLTAAHRTLPFGTRVRVTNLRNQRTVVVRVTDRGPFGEGRIIDLSKAAARKLRMLRAGVVPVRLAIVVWGRNCRTFHGRTTCRPTAPPRAAALRARRAGPAARPPPRGAPRASAARRSLRRAQRVGSSGAAGRVSGRPRAGSKAPRPRPVHRRWKRIRSPLLAPAWTPTLGE